MFFSLLLILFKNSSCSFTEDILRLVFDFVPFAGFVASSGVGSHVEIWFKFFIGNNLLLKVLRTFSLAVNNNHKLLKKDFFSSDFFKSL